MFDKKIVESIIPTLNFKFPYTVDDFCENMYLENYHSHKYGSNPIVPDSPTSIEDYLKRVKELGAKCLYTMEHGWQGMWYSTYNLAMDNNLRFIFGTEAYWVKDRHEKDKTNCHIIIHALNDEGRKEINFALSRANEDGYYYRPRMDLELIMALNPENVIITSACFRKGAKVLTKDGYKPIETITYGDIVKNMYGLYEKVNFPTRINYSGEGYKLHVSDYIEPIECTSDHKFLVNTINRGRNNRPPQWLSAADFVEQQIKSTSCRPFLLYPVNCEYSGNDIITRNEFDGAFKKECIEHPFKHRLPDEIKLTPKLMRWIGYFIGDGSITLYNPRVNLAIHDSEYLNCYRDDFITPVENQLGISFSVGLREENHKADLTCSYVDFVNFIYYLFGNCKAESKHIPDRLLHISKELDAELFYGMMLADGCFKQTKRDKWISGRLTYATISPKLACQLQDLMNTLGIDSSYHIVDEHTDNHGVHHCEAYYIDSCCKTWGILNKESYMSHENLLNVLDHLYDDSIKSPFFTFDGVKYKRVRIKNIEPITINEEVYCLNDDTHSFIVNGVIVHNCIAGWHYEDAEDIWIRISKKFKKHFFLEVQYHDTVPQRALNKKILRIAKENNIQIICGLDSHYIYPNDAIKRDQILEYKSISYPDEEGWYMDYPDTQTVYDRFVKQGVLTEEEILRAIMNTNIFASEEVTDIVFDKGFKIPTLYPNLSYEEKCSLFKKLLNEEYKKEEVKNNDKAAGIRYEVNEIIKSGVVDYFLTSNKIIKNAVKEEGGILTTTARGSASSFFTNKLLGFTTIDRFNSDVPIYPERFLTADRVLAGSMPD